MKNLTYFHLITLWTWLVDQGTSSTHLSQTSFKVNNKYVWTDFVLLFRGRREWYPSKFRKFEYRRIPGTRKILKVGYRWIPGTRQILKVEYRVPGKLGYRVPAREKFLGTDEYRVLARQKFLGTDGYRQEKDFGYRWVPSIGKIFNYANF